MAELAAAGAVAFSDDGNPIADPALFRSALITAGALDLPLIEHCEDPALTQGGEAADGLVATALGLRPWPAAGEISAVARNIALLRDAIRDEPRARLHLTHLSTGAALDAVRAARAEGPPLPRDPTPHPPSLTAAWLAGDPRWAWEYNEQGPQGILMTDAQLLILLSTLSTGLILGAIFSLVAAGVTIVYGCVWLPNASNGQFFLLASLVAWTPPAKARPRRRLGRWSPR